MHPSPGDDQTILIWLNYEQTNVNSFGDNTEKCQSLIGPLGKFEKGKAMTGQTALWTQR